MDMRAVKDPIFCFVQQHNAINIFNTLPRFFFFLNYYEAGWFKALFVSELYSFIRYVLARIWMVGTVTQIIDLGQQVPQVYKQCLCSIFMTDLMSQAWTIGGMYTTTYTTACPPPAWMCWSQINPGPHPGRWMLCVPSTVHPLSWAGAGGWWADTPPKPWARISQLWWPELSQHLRHQAA